MSNMLEGEYGYPGHPAYPLRQLSTGGDWYPKWIPCTACHKSLEYHIDKKCPFDSTEFRPDEDTIALILGEMRLQDRKLQAEEDGWNYGKDPNMPVKRVTLEDSIRRYFLAYEVVVDTLVGKLNIE